MVEKNPKNLKDISVIRFLKMVESAYSNSERELNDKDRKGVMSSAGYCQNILELSDYENHRKDLLSCSEKLKKIEENYSKIKPNLVTLNKDEFEFIAKCFTEVYKSLVKKSRKLITETRCGYGGLSNVDDLYKEGIELFDKILEDCTSPLKNKSEKQQAITDTILYCTKLSSVYKDIIEVSNKNLDELKSKAEIAVNMNLDMSVYNYILPSDFSLYFGYVSNACNLAAKGILKAAEFAIDQKKANKQKTNGQKTNKVTAQKSDKKLKTSDSEKPHGERHFFPFFKKK